MTEEEPPIIVSSASAPPSTLTTNTSAWEKTYAATSKNELIAAYADWAETYDADSVERFGYAAPRKAAEVLVEYLTANHLASGGRMPNIKSSILDVGAGTGQVGQHLQRMGFKNVFGVDYSPHMLAIAEQKGCYQDLYCLDLHEDTKTLQHHMLGSNKNKFDAAISVGTFTPHHVGIPALKNVLDLLKSPGGLLVLSLREDFVKDTSNGFMAALDDLQASGRLVLKGVTEQELYTSKVSDTICFRCWTFETACEPPTQQS